MTLLLSVGALWAQTSAFTYQGLLTLSNSAPTGVYDLRFALYDTTTSTNVIGTAQTAAAVPVTQGRFTVILDFGTNAFGGGTRWLEIGVRPADEGEYVTLTPRQLITSTPYATLALRAANYSGQLPAANLTGTLPDDRLSANVPRLNSNAVFSGSVTAASFLGAGTGLTSVAAASLTGIVPDARLAANVARLNADAAFSGTVSAPLFHGNGRQLTNVPGRIFNVVPVGSAIEAYGNYGYLATNDTVPVVVTLPASPDVGETIRVSASGAAGWILAQNSGQTVLLGNLLDAVGLSWTTNGSSQAWKAVAASADGRKLVAAVGTSGNLYTSTDYGATWTARYGPANWSGVASSGDGNNLVATLNGGQIYTSANAGTNWTARYSSAAWSAVASSANGNILAAVVNGGQIHVSVNGGLNWTPRASSQAWTAICASADGQRLAATVQAGYIYVSANAGTNWVQRESIRSWTTIASSADGSRLVAGANGDFLYQSLDYGLTWRSIGVATGNWRALASSADGSRLVAGMDLGNLFVSSDFGLSWSERKDLPGSLQWTGAAVSSDAGVIAAVAKGPGRIYVSSKSTTTVGTAGYLRGDRLSAVELVYCGDGVFMPISSLGRVQGY